ncbi:hypothetical protein [Streptomyces sp. NPDC002215]|uniref:hypothetical protein n=1 Tax=Streptomyces sp. NPDC002215 TaxID=3154412 RepID=UPI003328B0C4
MDSPVPLGRLCRSGTVATTSRSRHLLAAVRISTSRSLATYAKAVAERAAAVALQKQDVPLFGSLGIGVESDLHCRALHRLGRNPSPAT